MKYYFNRFFLFIFIKLLSVILFFFQILKHCCFFFNLSSLSLRVLSINEQIIKLFDNVHNKYNNLYINYLVTKSIEYNIAYTKADLLRLLELYKRVKKEREFFFLLLVLDCWLVALAFFEL